MVVNFMLDIFTAVVVLGFVIQLSAVSSKGLSHTPSRYFSNCFDMVG